MVYSLSLLSILLVVVSVVCVSSGTPTPQKNKEELLLKMKRWERCETTSDCAEDECCVNLLKSKVKICKRRPDLGNHCRPDLMPGFGHICPCALGLTCALTAVDNYGRRDMFRCVLVPEEEREIAARQH